MMRATRTDLSTGRSSTEIHHDITSFTQQGVQQFAEAARGHWTIENQLHWVLDMAFDEDQNRARTDDAAENFAIVRHIALNLLKAEQSKKKRSVKTKRKRCGWDHDYILRVIVINTL